MTPLDEMRAGFEAKHPPPENIYYEKELNRYVYQYLEKHTWDEVNAGTVLESRQNALWQGYQSGREDRGEAVAAWNGHLPLHLQQRINALRLELPQFIVDDLENAIRTAMADVHTAPQPALDQSKAELYIKDHAEWDEGGSLGNDIELAQPVSTEVEAEVDAAAQPDQWNAAIEAAANAASRAVSKEHAELSILALRKGA